MDTLIFSIWCIFWYSKDFSPLHQKDKESLHSLLFLTRDLGNFQDGQISFEEFVAMMKTGTDWRKASRQYSRERFKSLSLNLMKDGSLQLQDGLTGQTFLVWVQCLSWFFSVTPLVYALSNLYFNITAIVDVIAGQIWLSRLQKVRLKFAHNNRNLLGFFCMTQDEKVWRKTFKFNFIFLFKASYRKT